MGVPPDDTSTIKSKEKEIMSVPNTPLLERRGGDSWSRGLLALKGGIHGLRARLGTRGLIMLAAAIIAAGLALNWSWLVAIGAAPLLLTALPCLAMCALGLCMMPKGERSGTDQTADDVHGKDTPLPRSDGRPNA